MPRDVHVTALRLLRSTAPAGVRRVVRALYAHSRRTVRGEASGERFHFRYKFAPDWGSQGSGGTKDNRITTQNSPTQSARLKFNMAIYLPKKKEESVPVVQILFFHFHSPSSSS
jgi:hypothetical protein